MSIQITALHGFLGQPSDFEALGERLTNSGVSLQALNLNSLSLELDEIPSFLLSQRPTGFKRNILLGYSMGGRLALEVLRDQLLSSKNNWDGFIFISVNPGLKFTEEKEIRLKNDLLWADRIMSLPWAEFIRQWNNQEALRDSKEPTRIEHNYQKEGLARQLDRWSLARQLDSSSLLKQVNFPVLWISGNMDKKFCSIAEGLNGPCLKKSVVPHSGHRVIFDNSEGLFYSINQWL